MSVEVKKIRLSDGQDEAGHSNAAMLRRLREVLGGVSNYQVGDMTGFNSETVRRYRRKGGMRAEFITAVALAYEVNADWLLTGRGSRSIQLGKPAVFAEYLREMADQLQTQEETQLRVHLD